MEFKLIRANVIVLAKNHNPSIASKEWLTRNKIIEEEITSFTHLPVVSVIDTNSFNLVVDPERLVLSVKEISSDNLTILPKIISKYVAQLPETTYTAIGFNYHYRFEISQKKLKDTLLIDASKLKKLIGGDYGFGGIVTFQFNDFAVTLTFRPTSGTEITGEFNFHHKCRNREEITRKLLEHAKTKKRAEELLGGLFYA